jgi:hypothetical protein
MWRTETYLRFLLEREHWDGNRYHSSLFDASSPYYIEVDANIFVQRALRSLIETFNSICAEVGSSQHQTWLLDALNLHKQRKKRLKHSNVEPCLCEIRRSCFSQWYISSNARVGTGLVGEVRSAISDRDVGEPTQSTISLSMVSGTFSEILVRSGKVWGIFRDSITYDAMILIFHIECVDMTSAFFGIK